MGSRAASFSMRRFAAASSKVRLVPDFEQAPRLGLGIDAELGKDGIDVGALMRARLIGDVAHMQDQIGFDHLFQRGAEGCDQHGRQVGDEPHRVGEHGLGATRQANGAMGRIERGEQRVLGEHAGAGQRIEQGRLAGIGVADESHGRIGHPRPRFPVQRARAAHLLELGANALDPVADDAPVGFDLGLTGATEKAEAAALTLKVGPGAHEPALLIDEMSKLDLQAPFPRARPRAEDLENESGAVENLGAPRGLQIALLHRGERVIDDHELRTLGADQAFELGDLA